MRPSEGRESKISNREVAFDLPLAERRVHRIFGSTGSFRNRMHERRDKQTVGLTNIDR